MLLKNIANIIDKKVESVKKKISIIPGVGLVINKPSIKKHVCSPITGLVFRKRKK